LSTGLNLNDIFSHFGQETDHHDKIQNITITYEVELLLPSSIELYSILLTVRQLHRAKMSATISTDFAEVVRIQSKDQLRNWGQKTNLCIYEAIVSLLETAPRKN